MADTKLAKVGITVKGSWHDDISFEVLDYTLWRVEDGGDGCGYIAKKDNIGVLPNSDDKVWIKATQAGQSIYDLAVKYGHFDGTEEEFEAEYQAALKAARDAASETSATNTEIQEAENLRVSAENARVEAENVRESNESARQTAETARENAETGRANAETARETAEGSRENAESSRETAEGNRETAEATRQSNEEARKSAELERTSDFEALVTDMQTATGQADAATAAADAINRGMVADETARITAENARVSAENERASAETARQTAEGQRATAEGQMATAETSRANAESGRVTAENARVTAESNRATAEQGRVQAETARETQAESDHSRADSDHEIAENDHATLDERIAHKADIDGSYDSMAVGLAKNLEGRTDVTDSFFERTTGGDAEVANGTGQLLEVKGKSQVWNQAVKDDGSDLRNTRTAYNVNFTNNADGTITISGISNSSGSLDLRATTKMLANHKYLMSVAPYPSGQAYAGAHPSKALVTKTEDTSTTWGVLLTNGAEYNVTFRPQLIDLTLLGIDNLTTVEEVEAWLAENIGEQAYYPYNEGEVLNNKMTGVESIGFNLLDPATGKADIIGAYSDVYGNYYGITGTHGALTFTDKFGNTETITPDEDGKFLLEKAGTLSVADAGEDCAVFLWWDGTQTEYKPYEKNVGALDVTHIYGKLNGEGEYVRLWPTGMPGIGDVKDSLKVVDGQVVAERKIAEVDMGDLTWRLSGTVFYSDTDIHQKMTTGITSICSKYEQALNQRNTTQSETNLADKSICVGSIPEGQPRVFAKDSSYATYADFKTALSGVLLYYELATPQVFTDLIYRDSESLADNTPVTLPVNYKVDNWGIERIAPQNTEDAVVTAKPELTMRYSIDAVEELNTHRDEIDDLYDKNAELDARKPEKYGEYPDMAVGSAKALAGNDTKVEDFFFTPIDAADGLAKLNAARGKSLVWNQMNKDNARNKELTVSSTTGRQTVSNDGDAVSFYASHKYLFKATITTLDESGRVWLWGGGRQYPVGLVSNYNFATIDQIAADRERTSSFTVVGRYEDGEAVGTFGYKDLIVIDLTLMFGAGNEPATVAEFEAMFPLPYYDYNEGEIISNKTEEVKVVGFNQWDEEWEQGSLSAVTGLPVANGSLIRSKNFCPCLPNTTYCKYSKSTSTSYINIFWYDSAKNFISVGSGSSLTIQSPTNAMFFKIRTDSQYAGGGTYLNDICINLSDPARNGEYEPYKTNTIELNLPTLTGKLNGEGESVVVFPDGLKSAGSVYDEVVGNKAIKRVGVVDLGTLTWRRISYDGTDYCTFDASVSGLPAASAKVGLLCSMYENGGTRIMGATYATADNANKIFNRTNMSAVFCVGNDASVEAFVSKVSGVLLYYELATPEEYILDAPLPDTFQAYKGGTIKQLPENTSEPVTAPMVMTVTYAIDAVGTLVGLPRNYVSKESLQAMLNAMQSAGIIASYTMTFNENTGKYDFTFTAPSN